MICVRWLLVTITHLSYCCRVNEDAEGFIWVALSGAGRVVRIDPFKGSVDIVVHLPVKCPTSVTFGGADLDELFITTRGPDGGGIYRVKVPFGIRGLPEPGLKLQSEVEGVDT